MMGNVKFHGAKLREALRFRGIRMADLARATDISRQSLSLYANDENRPSVDNMLKIAKYLDFPMEFFLMMIHVLWLPVIPISALRQQHGKNRRKQRN